METLLINPGREDEAWGLLDELAGLYGDNGGDPDGNAWLPSMPITEDEAEPALEAGAGEMIHALYFDGDELDNLAATLGIEDVLALARLEGDDWEAFRNAVDDHAKLWAHYGAYGAGDEIWVVVG